MNWTIIKIIVILRSFCATKTTHFSSRLWHVMRSGSSMTTGNIQHSGWMPEKLHNTSQSRNCTKKRLCGGLQPVSSITASWIRAKRLRRRSTANKLTKCTRSSNMCPRLVNMKGPILLHDNACPHVAQLTLQKLNELGYETASFAIFTRPLTHRLSLFQASRQLPARKMLLKPRWCRISLQRLHRFQNSRFLC